MMQSWLIEPRDGLTFRDGRPNTGRSESRSLRFPLPQTVAGAVRTRAGLDSEGRFDLDRTEAVKALSCHGPLLARSGAQGWELLAPAPLDALWEEAADPLTQPRRLHQLQPLADPVLRGGSVIPESMSPVGLVQTPKGKPPRDSPAFWTWTHLMGWLHRPGQVDAAAIRAQGQAPLAQEERLSVAIDPETSTYRHGALFGVTSLVFRSSRQPVTHLKDVQELALTLRTDAVLTPGPGFLGGKNKLANFQPKGAPVWPEVCPFLGELARPERLRVLLLTPGIFQHGWKPTWLLQPRQGLMPTLRAARVERPETLSGWDYQHQRTKATRRAVSAGAVYWLELGGTPEQRKAWIQEMWMQPMSDEEQDRRDGFGLAVMGVWA